MDAEHFCAGSLEEIDDVRWGPVAFEMPVSVDEQSTPVFCENLTLYDSGRKDVAIPEVTDLLGDGTSWIVLIDGRISQQDTQLSFLGSDRFTARTAR